jgi:hypothetical protein
MSVNWSLYTKHIASSPHVIRMHASLLICKHTCSLVILLLHASTHALVSTGLIVVSSVTLVDLDIHAISIVTHVPFYCRFS